MKSDVQVAKMLLELGVVSLRPDDPFRYTSGILSPIYTDLRVLISHPAERKKICELLEQLARANYRQIEAVAGTSTAGIPWAAWLAASSFNVPMVYVRDRAKRHGQKNQIEGILKPGAKTLVVDDLISTGGSALGSVHAVRRAGAQPLAVVAIFTYQMKTSVEAFRKAQTPLHTLTNFPTLVDVAGRLGKLTKGSQEKVLEWAQDPPAWGKKMGFDG